MTTDQSGRFRQRSDEAALGVAELFEPPRRIRVSESAAESLYVVSGNGTKALWSPQAAPYMVKPMDSMSSREYDAVIFVGPARTGKTMALLDGFLAYKIINAPADGLVVQITEDKAAQFSKKRLNREFNASPELKSRLSPRTHDNNVHDKIFKNGSYLGIQWPSKNVFASSDFEFVLLTDYDRMTQDIDGEGSPFLLASKRTTTFGSTGMSMAESSPGRPILDPDWRQPADEPHAAPPTTGILDLYNRGDRQRLYWKCPQHSCRQWFQPVLENFNLDSSVVYCPHCGTEVDPKLKRQLNLEAEWIPEGCWIDEAGQLQGQRRRGRIASFWMEGPAASYQTWAQLTEKLCAAEKTYEDTDDQQDLKTVYNTDWGRPYKDRVYADARSSLQLLSRAEDIERRTVPEGVRFLLATVDVQGGENRRFVVQIHGFGVGRESWIVDRFNIAEDRGPENDQAPRRISPATQPEDWDLLTRDVIRRTYRLGDGSGRRMPILAVGVDTGGEGKGAESVTSQAYEWFRRLRKEGLHQRAHLLKGGSTTTVNRVTKTWPDNTNRKSRKSKARGDIPMYILGTDLLKDAVAGMIDRDSPGAWYLHVPSWLGRWWHEEMTAEVKKPSGKWERIGKRANEAFDLTAYSLAEYIIIGAEGIDWDAPPLWAAAWDKNALVFHPDDDNRPEPAARRPAARQGRRVVKPKI
ncbi:MAG: terminase gpA endonuclease subunit [Pseudomonadota bacterium]